MAIPFLGMVKHPLVHSSFAGSTRVDSGTYNRDTREVLLVFPDGVHWWYRTVPLSVWNEFVRAPSAGMFLRERLDHYPNGPA